MSDDKVGHRSRLRKRYKESGFSSLLDYEKLELLLTFPIPRRDVKGLAKALLSKYGDLYGVLSAPYDELLEFDGFGESSYLFFSIVRDIFMDLDSINFKAKDRILTTKDCGRFLIKRNGQSKLEQFTTIYLSSSSEVLKIVDNEVGDIDRVYLYPRKILKVALEVDAAGIIISHNHPSGDTTPSKDDIELTKTLLSGCETLAIHLIDHIIVTKNQYLSFLEKGYLNSRRNLNDGYYR